MNFSVRVAGLTVNFSYANLISPEIPNSLDCWILSILITPLYPKPNVCRSGDPGYPFYFIDSYWINNVNHNDCQICFCLFLISIRYGMDYRLFKILNLGASWLLGMVCTMTSGKGNILFELCSPLFLCFLEHKEKFNDIKCSHLWNIHEFFTKQHGSKFNFNISFKLLCSIDFYE